MVNSKQSDSIFESLEILKHYTLSLEQKTQLCLFTCACVEQILPLYETLFPENQGPRHLVEVTQQWLRKEVGHLNIQTVVSTEEAKRYARSIEGPPPKAKFFNWSFRAAMEVEEAAWGAAMVADGGVDINRVIQVVKLTRSAQKASYWAKGKSQEEFIENQIVWQEHRFRKVLE